MPLLTTGAGAYIAGGGGGGGGYTAQGVHFDGSVPVHLTSTSLTGAAASKVGTFSAWLKLTSTGTTCRLLNGSNSIGFNLQFIVLNNGPMWINLFNSAGTQILHLPGTTNIQSGGWKHILASWDTGAGIGQYYLNDVTDIDGANLTTTNDTADWPLSGGTGPLYAIGDNGTGGQWIAGDVADLYINNATALDLSVSANRRKFISAGGAPVDLGTDGSTPTGTAPIIYQSGAVASWATNKASGGGFTANSALTAASSNPP